MRLLLDTHALVRWLTDDPTLPSPARDRIAEPANEVLVSAASAMETALVSNRLIFDAFGVTRVW